MSSSEEETLLPHDTPVTQHPDHPLRMNIITGTAVIAQLGLWLLFILVWYSTLSTDIILPSYHPLLNSLALVFLINALLLLQPTHTAGQKREGAINHSILTGLAAVSFTAGVAVIWWNKHIHSSPHFTSVHGKLGITLFIVIGIQVLVGILQFYAPNLLGGQDKAKAWYKWHRAAGYIITTFIIVNVTLGTQTPYFRGKIDNLAVWIVFDILIIAGLVARIKPSKMKLF